MKIIPLMKSLRAPSGSVPMSELMAHLNISREHLMVDIKWAFINRLFDMYINNDDELVYTLLPEGEFFRNA
ncbi:TPA: hypothetical protein QHB92_000206 [Klebsiella quasipneumoniae subsp. similipneumoniae]|nr:hypothetical protein [Klebsiella quasipneumoniae subsp. similipneumoniae]